MSGRIKCTYDDCFKHFATVEAMKKHKAKDEAHDYYCKRCDYDATDDNYLLFHQITSPKHICCPVCCREFKSEGGRDRHVEIDHVPKQSINCVGCNEHFENASGLMRHIEEDECTIIKKMHFHRQRAEKQISKDHWNATFDPTAGSTVLSNSAINPTDQPELTLLDDERAWINTDWQGKPVHDPEHEQNGPYVGSIEGQMSGLSIQKFPPLGTQSNSHTTLQAEIGPESGLESVDQDPPQSQPGLPSVAHQNNSAWTRPRNSELPGPSSQYTASDNQSSMSINLLEQSNLSKIDASVATKGTRYQDNRSLATSQADFIHIPTIPHSQHDPNAHITTTTAVQMPTVIDINRFWDPISEMFICPSPRCGVRLSTAETFKTHLISGAHIGGKVRCPGCLKQFKSTTALIAHCESGSRKCKVRNAFDYDLVIKEITAGLLATDGSLEDGSVRYVAQKIEDW